MEVYLSSFNSFYRPKIPYIRSSFRVDIDLNLQLIKEFVFFPIVHAVIVKELKSECVHSYCCG